MDIFIIFMCHLSLCLHCLSYTNISYFLSLFVYIFIIYFYYTSSQMIEFKVRSEENLIKINIINWEEKVNNCEFAYIQWLTLNRTVDQLVDYNVTHV